MNKTVQPNNRGSTKRSGSKKEVKSAGTAARATRPGRPAGVSKTAADSGSRSAPAKKAEPKSVKRRNKRSGGGKRPLFARLLRLMAWVCAFGAFWCAYLLWTINSYSPPKELAKADAAIVLGAALWNDVPSPGLKERLDHAYKLYEQGVVSHLILSGGLDSNGASITEAEGMRNYLVEQKGMPPERLVLEDKSTSTYENLLFSKPLAKLNGWNSIIIVTHDYHAVRAGEIASFIGYENTVTAGFKSQVLSAARNQSREVLAMTKWKLDAFLMLIGVRSTGAL
ncbi:YdcF family protein [Paenibacillus sp. GCM10027626]|uniref:YdcF family protein n=1 Tax=Paenibacillus sp. GCM10027626 TaxID=3273411 RepID=UPI00363D77E2